jgi:hypothetical protein
MIPDMPWLPALIIELRQAICEMSPGGLMGDVAAAPLSWRTGRRLRRRHKTRESITRVPVMPWPLRCCASSDGLNDVTQMDHTLSGENSSQIREALQKNESLKMNLGGNLVARVGIVPLNACLSIT